MSSFVEDLRHAPTPQVFQSKTRLIDAIKRVHVALIRSSLGDPGDLSVQNDIVGLRDYALWLEGIALRDDDGRDEYHALAASIFEFVGTLLPQDETLDLFSPPLNDLIHSAILSSLTSFQAHSTLIGRRVFATLEGYEPHGPVERCDHTTALVIAALLKRDFPASFRFSQRLRSLGDELMGDADFMQSTNVRKLHIDRLLALGHACGLASLAMLVGSVPLFEVVFRDLDRVRAKALEREDGTVYWLADRLLRVVQHMSRANIRMLLSGTHLPPVYPDLLAREGYFEFWGPQLDAIEKGILNRDRSDHFVVSVPTGSGKSLFAELSILNALGNNRSGWAVYVAPSRALVSQVSNELRHRLERCGISVRTVLAGAEQSSLLEEELALLGTNGSVTVTTPEKLDVYYRNARDLFDGCKVIVFDEAHKIADSSRGALIESLIARFLLLQRGTQILMLSGMMDNAQEIAEWFGTSQTQVVTAEARATRQAYAVAVRTDLVVASTPHHAATGYTRRMDFKGGLVVVHERDDLEGIIEVDIPNAFEGFFRERLNERRGLWREDNSLQRSTTTDHAISLTASLNRARETILVFVTNVASARKGCRESILGPHKALRSECELLATYVAEELGAGHELVQFCRRGVAYHHARLPANVQRAIELALQEGWLSAVFATPTLREGINTAVTTVILAGTHFYNVQTQRQDELSEADFFNIAGRAGRPRAETEGRIILIPDSLVQAVAVESGKKYILASRSVLRVVTQFRAVTDDIKRNHGSLFDLSLANQRLLLSLEAAGLRDEIQLSDFFGSTLWSIQDPERDLTAVMTSLANAFEQATATVGEDRFALAARLGLSLTSSEQMYDAIASRVAVFSEEDGDRRTEQLSVLLETALSLPEFAQGDLRFAPPAKHLPSLQAWLAGESYTRILERAVGAGAVASTATVNDVVRYCSDLSTLLSWAFGVAYAIIRTLTDNVDPYIGALPLLTRYGVPDSVSAYIALLGVSDRTASRRLADRFAQTGRAISLSEVLDWLNSGDIGELLPDEEQNSVRLRVIRNQISRRRFGPDPFVNVRFSASERVRVGTILSCSIEGGDIVWVVDGRSVATTPIDHAVRPFLARGTDHVVGVVTEIAYNQRSGSLSLLSFISVR